MQSDEAFDNYFSAQTHRSRDRKLQLAPTQVLAKGVLGEIACRHPTQQPGQLPDCW
jgi:hypothetical protein